MEEIVAEHPASAMQENSLKQIYMGCFGTHKSSVWPGFGQEVKG